MNIPDAGQTTAARLFSVTWIAGITTETIFSARDLDDAYEKCESDAGPIPESVTLPSGVTGHIGEWQPDGDPYPTSRAGVWAQRWNAIIDQSSQFAAADADHALEVAEGLAAPDGGEVTLTGGSAAHYDGWTALSNPVPTWRRGDEVWRGAVGW